MQKQDFVGSPDIQSHIFAYKTNGILRIAFHFFIYFIIMGEVGDGEAHSSSPWKWKKMKQMKTMKSNSYYFIGFIRKCVISKVASASKVLILHWFYK